MTRRRLRKFPGTAGSDGPIEGGTPSVRVPAPAGRPAPDRADYHPRKPPNGAGSDGPIEGGAPSVRVPAPNGRSAPDRADYHPRKPPNGAGSDGPIEGGMPSVRVPSPTGRSAPGRADYHPRKPPNGAGSDGPIEGGAPSVRVPSPTGRSAPDRADYHPRKLPNGAGFDGPIEGGTPSLRIPAPTRCSASDRGRPALDSALASSAVPCRTKQPKASIAIHALARTSHRLVSAHSLLWLLTFVFATNANAAIMATLDRQTIDELSTARLTLRAEGANQTEELDLSPLESAFEVLGTNTTTQFRSINGQISQWVEYQINLRPKRSGLLEIPPLSLGGQQSPLLRLQVTPLDAGVRDAIEAMIFFEAEAIPNPVRVQAQTILTRSLFYAKGVQVYSDLPGAPEISGALVVPIGENRSGTAVRKGRSYGVLEQRYAVFPEQKGRLIIPEISVMSSVRLPGPTGGRRSGIRVNTPEIQIEVLPIPSDYPADAPWLPAEEVSITEAWLPANPQFHVGEPVQRIITVNVTGNTGSSVPPLNLNLPERFFKQYPEPVLLSDGNIDLGAQGRRQETYALIPVRPGEATLPELKLTWWDSVNEQVREAILPARTLRITGKAPAGQGSLEQKSADDVSAQEQQRGEPGQALNTEPDLHPETDAPSPHSTAYPLWLLALTVAGFLGWMATWLLMRNRRLPTTAPAQADSAATAWKALNQACKTDRMEAMRNAWLKYLSAHWQLSAANTLTRIRRTPKARELLERLNRALYASDPSGETSGQELLDATRALVKEERAAERTATPLSALNG